MGADEMLSHGFKDQIYDIFKCLPSTVQVCLFSATMAPEILDLTKKFMRDPVRILVKEAELTLEGIQQFYIALAEVGALAGCAMRPQSTVVVQTSVPTVVQA